MIKIKPHVFAVVEFALVAAIGAVGRITAGAEVLTFIKYAADGALIIVTFFIVDPFSFSVVYECDITFIAAIVAMGGVFTGGVVMASDLCAAIAAHIAAGLSINGFPVAIMENMFNLALIAAIVAVGRIKAGGFVFEGFAFLTATAGARGIASGFAIGHPNLLLFVCCSLHFTLVAASFAYAGVGAGLPVGGNLAGIAANGADIVVAGLINAPCFKRMLGLFGFAAALAAIVSALVIAPYVVAQVGGGGTFGMDMPHRAQNVQQKHQATQNGKTFHFVATPSKRFLSNIIQYKNYKRRTEVTLFK